MQKITLLMHRLGALQFMGVNDVLQLQMLIRTASGQLNQMRIIAASETAFAESLEHACKHLQQCITLLHELELPHLLRFTLVKQRAISTLQLFLLRKEISRCQFLKDRSFVRVLQRAGILQLALAYIGPICSN